VTRYSAAGYDVTTIILAVEVVRAIMSVRIQLSLGIFEMNTFVLLPRQESMAQRGACKHDQWRGYMTFLVINHGIIKCISILSAVNRPNTKFDVNNPRDRFRWEVKWTLAIR